MATEASSTTVFTLPSDREIAMERMFDAPRELVWKVSNDPTLISQWWGPRRYTTTVDKMDVTPGGLWRLVHRDSGGNEFAFNGVYREVVPPERVVRTFEFEGMPGHVVVETATLEDLGGRTRLTVTSLFETTEDRDGMLQSGMESGATESMDRLAELLAQT
ncbi:MAG TPA: SRPBCC family protein [Dehalococcoidia bacterium]|nr:SRPBCC family protein [Dehalococcoidia bacterium]